MRTQITLAALAAAISWAASAAVYAGQILEESGTDSLIVEVQALQLDEGHTLVWYWARGTKLADDPKSPAHLATGDCVGTADIMPNNKFKVNGYCAWTDRDGDKFFGRTWQDSSMAQGAYEYIGGTGKWKGVGRGTYVATDLSKPPQGRTVSRFKGVNELK